MGEPVTFDAPLRDLSDTTASLAGAAVFEPLPPQAAQAPEFAYSPTDLPSRRWYLESHDFQPPRAAQGAARDR